MEGTPSLYALASTTCHQLFAERLNPIVLMSNLKKKFISGLALAFVALTTVGGLAVSSQASAASYTGSLSNVMVAGDISAADTLNNAGFGGIVNFIYSMVSYLVSFFMQATVLSVVVALVVIGYIAMKAWHVIKQKSMGLAGGGGKKKRGR